MQSVWLLLFIRINSLRLTLHGTRNLFKIFLSLVVIQNSFLVVVNFLLLSRVFFLYFIKETLYAIKSFRYITIYVMHICIQWYMCVRNHFFVYPEKYTKIYLFMPTHKDTHLHAHALTDTHKFLSNSRNKSLSSCFPSNRTVCRNSYLLFSVKVLEKVLYFRKEHLVFFFFSFLFIFWFSIFGKHWRKFD